MRITDTAVKRPIFAIVINLLLLTFGLVAFTMLPLREYPDIETPIVSVSTNYTGASAEVVETKITQVLENRISGIEGIKSINSSSRNGSSNITIEFNIDRDIDAAANDVRERVSRALDRLPEQVRPPEVSKSNSDESPIAWFVLNSETMDTLQLSDYAQRFIVDRLAVVDGVSNVRIGGERQYAMKIWLDRKAMAARGVTSSDIEQVLRRENVELPAGEIESVDRDFSVRIARSYKTQEDFDNLVIKRGEQGYLVRLGEVAQVVLEAADDESTFRGNGKNMIGLGVVKQAKANTLEVVDNARKELEKIKRNLPQGTTIEDSYDSSIFIRESIAEVYSTLAIAMALVVLVIYIFLGNIRATLIPAVTVPVALVATFMFLLAMGYSINLLTLLALVLAIGLVVDDAIVMLENIYRRIELGEPKLLAAYRGAREVGFAIIATTLVLVAVFIPLVFMDGRIGALFTEFAFAVSAAVLFSSITALTLSPALCSKVLKPSNKENRFSQWMDRQFGRLEQGYRRVLQDNLSRKYSLIVMLALAGFTSYSLFKQIPSELTPKEDRGTFFVMMNGPEGASYENNSQNMAKIEERLLPYVDSEELSRVLIRVPGWGGQGGVAIIGMPDWDERKRSTWEVMDEISGKMQDVTDIRAFAIMRRGIGGGGNSRPIEFVLQGNDYDELAAWRDRILERARENKGLVRLDHDYKETFPQFLISIDKTKAADLGVSVSAIGQTLETMLGQRRVTTFIDRGEEYDVILKGTKADFSAPDNISDIYVKSRSDELVPLDSLITIKEEATASRLNRYNRMRAITITANLAGDYTLEQALDFLNKVAAEENDIDGAIDYKGESQLFYEGASAMTYVFILALTVTFLVLAAQFESFVHPLVIMLTVPLGLVGAMYGLFITDSTLNIYSQIGIVMLIGLSAKNGILIVEFANQLRDKGIAFEQAIVDAAAQRLRPIIMTSLTTVMSSIPLVFATGPGFESRMVIGVVIFAGVSVATILTLFVIPTAYTLLAKKTQSPEETTKRLEEQSKQHPEQEV
ncbi:MULTISPECIES: efflux RND transporter permease subunit [Pseudoalteromonas]|uniref:AcrB/AcrD/AcrF family protein n=1 Tax=Pseudoalteromonas piscicida TaxID=43662 RepID=A0AAQ2EVW3_PSEO7|nr:MULTISPECIES: efflux RND transporter permease subunit [Pseudoalteromonas]MCG7541403.1 efflux RND transporter permease subunit [Pseudoalteromonas sp. OF7H-1]MCO7200039.1 efflux RND transporter permease subunit [Pseudoalteromonas sp. OANN1]KJY86631.1 multidrug transporter AcrB [Pseudoalteromonas piscicida]KJY90917.1 multidrug transporter AcrB [Pseudoalteromonas piscicida]ODB35263.1 multidrug transporter AcrB [Pseudoalteromonas sp. BMB]